MWRLIPQTVLEFLQNQMVKIGAVSFAISMLSICLDLWMLVFYLVLEQLYIANLICYLAEIQ